MVWRGHERGYGAVRSVPSLGVPVERSNDPDGSPTSAVSDLTVEGAGLDEVAVLPWPLMVHRRISRRLQTGRPTNRWAVVVVALSGLFAVSISITVLSVVLTDIAADLHSTTSTLSWTILGPMLAFGVVSPVYGKAGDLFGHKRVFVLGLLGAAIFAVGSAMAPSALTLVMFRTLSATAGSATGPSSSAMITRLFEGDERVRALSYWSFVQAGAPVLGVVAGAPIVAAVGWRAVFWLQAPFLVVALVVALALLPETPRGARSSFDVRGAAFLAVGVTSLLFGVNRGPVWGWSDPRLVLAFLLCPAALAAFVSVERRAVEPLLPLEWLRHRNIVFPVAAQGCMNFAYIGGLLMSPLVLREVLHYTEQRTANVIIARPITFAIFAPLAAYGTVRVRERVASATGALIVAGSMLVLASITTGSGMGLVLFGLALSGLGFAVAAPAQAAMVAESVPIDDLGVAGALQQMVAQVGGVLGSGVMQSVQIARARSGLEASYRSAFVVGALVCVAGGVLSTFIRPVRTSLLLSRRQSS
jgi:MFS family permease